jgi:hypothetical protein
MVGEARRHAVLHDERHDLVVDVLAEKIAAVELGLPAQPAVPPVSARGLSMQKAEAVAPAFFLIRIDSPTGGTP